MAPKKKETTKLSLGEFLTDGFGKGSSWADEVEETYVPIGTQQLPPAREGSRLNSSSNWQDRGYSVRESVPSKLPEKAPFTAHIGNLSYDVTNDSVGAFFEGCDVLSIRIIEDREMMRSKGFGYVEFSNLDGLKKALDLDGQSFEGRVIRIKVAEPPRGGDARADSSRDLSDWSRKGPLPDLPGRSGPRQAPDFGERRPSRDPAAEPRPMREMNWERRGPLAPVSPELSGEGSVAGAPRDSSRSRHAPGGMGERSDSFRSKRADPAAWGEGREDRPRREFQERPERPERVPTAAEKDMRWRDRMRPDVVAQSPVTAEGSETPSSPAVPTAPTGRPRLALTKRTVTETTEVASTPSDSKASPFGAARPINTAAREIEIEEKRQRILQEKREADEKAKEEKRLAKEAAAIEAAAAEVAAKEAAAKEAAAKEAAAIEAAAAAAAAAKVEAEAEVKDAPVEATEAKQETEKTEGVKQNGAEQKLPFRNREPREPREPKEPRDFSQTQKSRATESGNWRSASNDQRNNRGPPGGPRAGRNGGRGGPRNDNRTPRSNGASGQEPAAAVESEAATVDEDGWTTVPNKKGRAGRPVMS